MGNSPVDRKIAALAARQFGHVAREQLVALGLSAAEIEYRIKIGRLIIVYRGVYAVGHPRTEPLARLKAAVLAGGPAAVISFSSAAFLWGLTKRLATPLELTVNGDRRIDGLRIHRSTTLGRRDITTQRAIRTTSPARTLLDNAPRYTDDDLDRAVNDALHHRWLNLSDLDELLYRLPHHPDASRLWPFIQDPTGITESRLEDAFARFVEHFGLPKPQTNTYIAGYRVDAVYHHHKLIIELDSWEFHKDRRAFENDRERDATTLALGYNTIRITWARLTGLSQREAHRLQNILAARQP